MAFNVNALGFGDNVVDRYEHIHTMYPGGNAVNFAVYAKKCGAARSAYMGIFGNDAAAEHVIASLEDEGIELAKCEQLIGENGAARVTVVDGDRVFLGSNEGGIRGDARYVLDRFDLAYMKQFDVVHSGNYCFTERELPKLKAAGITVSFDFSDDSTDEYYEQIAPFVDFAFFSAADAASEDEIRERLAWGGSRGLVPDLVLDVLPRFRQARRGRAWGHLACARFCGRFCLDRVRHGGLLGSRSSDRRVAKRPWGVVLASSQGLVGKKCQI